MCNTLCGGRPHRFSRMVPALARLFIRFLKTGLRLRRVCRTPGRFSPPGPGFGPVFPGFPPVVFPVFDHEHPRHLWELNLELPKMIFLEWLQRCGAKAWCPVIPPGARSCIAPSRKTNEGFVNHATCHSQATAKGVLHQKSQMH